MRETITWLEKAWYTNKIKLKVNGQVHDGLRRLNSFGGYSRFSEIRHCGSHAKEIQRMLVLGFIVRVSKDCLLCPGRQGNKVNCIGRKQRCASRYLYQMTPSGYQALKVLNDPVQSKPFCDVNVELSKQWFNYFQRHAW